MRLFLTLTLSLLSLILAHAQVVLLKTQAEVDAMAQGPSGIYALQIGSALDSEMSDITDLTPLAGIHSLYGAGLAIVNNPHLKSLQGLENFTHINGRLWILNNDSLINLVGLPATYTLGDAYADYRGIAIQENNLLESLDGLPFVPDLYGVAINNNPELENIDALVSYKKLRGLGIIGGKLTSLSGLDSLQYIGKTLSFRKLNNLTNLQGLNNLKYIGKDLNLSYNPNLISLEGIGPIKNLVDLRIYQCDALIDLSGLDSMMRITNLDIKNCAELSSLHGLEGVDSIGVLELEWAGMATLYGLENTSHVAFLNATNCPSLASIDQIGDSIIAGIDIDNCNNLQHIDRVKANRYITITNNKRLKNYGPFSNTAPFTAQKIIISNNDSLTTIEGLMGLERQVSDNNNDWINLGNNPMLKNTKGLDSLRFAIEISLLNTGILDVKNLTNLDSIKLSLLLGSPHLKDLTGLGNWHYAGGGPYLRADSLVNIDAIANNPAPLDFGSLILDDCFSLDSIYGFNQLVSGYLHQLRILNSSLFSINGLSNIDSIKVFRIFNNNSIKQISGLESLTYIGASNEFHTNPSLMDISGLCNLFANGTINGSIDIHDNAPGFNSIQEIKDWCLTPTYDLPTFDAIRVYPNPATDEFFLDVPPELIQVGMRVQLLDISGVSHFSARLHSSMSAIPVYDVPPGLYFLQMVYDGQLVQVKKVVVER